MTIVNEKFVIQTRGFTDIIDITNKVQNLVYKHELQTAQVLIYVPGSTVSITTIEYEPGLVRDFPEILDKIAPMDRTYHHDETWHDGNGYAHVRAALIGNSVVIPVIEGALYLGTWQQIVLVDFDCKPRTRNICIQIIN